MATKTFARSARKRTIVRLVEGMWEVDYIAALARRGVGNAGIEWCCREFLNLAVTMWQVGYWAKKLAPNARYMYRHALSEEIRSTAKTMARTMRRANKSA